MRLINLREKIEGTITNEESRDIGNIGNTRHMTNNRQKKTSTTHMSKRYTIGFNNGTITGYLRSIPFLDGFVLLTLHLST